MSTTLHQLRAVDVSIRVCASNVALGVFAVLAILVATPAGAAEVSYVPPEGAMPYQRLSGTYRGATDRVVVLTALVPEHVAVTASPQPELFWFQDGPVTSLTVFTLMDEQTGETPVKGVVLPSSRHEPGVYSVDLRRLPGGSSVQLAPGRLYRWTVSVVGVSGQPSTNAVAQGMARYEPLGKSVRPSLERDGLVHLAAAGRWYDALALAVRRWRQRPDSARTREDLNALLDAASVTPEEAAAIVGTH